MKIDIDRPLLEIVFDIATNSMDFSSGFLDDEEVIALREIATILGADLAKATPVNFICKYEYSGEHDWIDRGFGKAWLTCSRCGAHK